MRRAFRVKWWLDLTGVNCRHAIFPSSDDVPELLPIDLPATGYPQDSPPTFFGHYGMMDSSPWPISRNVACLDYGSGKGGFLRLPVGREEKIIPSKSVTAGTTGLN